MYSDDSLPNCVNLMVTCCVPLLSWMEDVSKLGDLMVAMAIENGSPIPLISGIFTFYYFHILIKKMIDSIFIR